MINLRLDEHSINDLFCFVEGKYPLTIDIAEQICSSEHPINPCTHVYGAYNNGNQLVAIMTATYSIVFPHEDGTRMVHISGAYTKEEYRHQGYATSLLKAIERDARDYFHADYLCCDSTMNNLYEINGFILAPDTETRLWKPL